ncbi:hypothetical protein [Singulisphaera sp. PoT]|uniref:hypothetical protein n=1 Tax=Singulisphaera sp. PoT TaxID=3411797 RepID=UPI003BF5A976
MGHPQEFWLGMVLYLASMAGAAWALQSLQLRGPAGVAVGLVPTLPMLMILHVYLRMVRRQDELYRRVQQEAIAIASGITIVFCFAAGFLETFGAIPRVSLQWAGILMFFTYAAAAGILMRRYT